MKAEATFSVSDFTPTSVVPIPMVTTATPSGVSTMKKTYAGQVVGFSATLFSAAFDPQKGIGTYLAMESFDGTIGGKRGTFNFFHSATTGGTDRVNEFFGIVPGSGTGELAGITGTGGLAIDPDGTHRIWFDYAL